MSKKTTYDIDANLFEQSVLEAAKKDNPNMYFDYRDERLRLLRKFLWSIWLRYKSYYYWKYKKRLPIDWLEKLIAWWVNNNFVIPH